MPLIECPHCSQETFTISGWADVDRCPNCGRPLAGGHSRRDVRGWRARRAAAEARRFDPSRRRRTRRS